VQILQDLKHAGLVVSTRGAAGGYQLTRPPQEISLADVLHVVEGNTEPSTCASADSPLAPVLLDVCQQLSAARHQQLASITLADLLSRATVQAGPMWYI
jgi:Rrf2 family protein